MKDSSSGTLLLILMVLAGFVPLCWFLWGQYDAFSGIEACRAIAESPVEKSVAKHEEKCRRLFEKTLPAKTKGWKDVPGFSYRGAPKDWARLHKKVNSAFSQNGRVLLQPVSVLTHGWVTPEKEKD